MAAIIRFTTPTLTLEFSASTGYDPPLVSQSLEVVRRGDQGSSYQKVNVQLSGFFLGNDNSEVQAKILLLLNILQSNEITLYYHDGARAVIDSQRVWVAAHSDPLEWKQYNGSFSLNLYYFRLPSHTDSALAVSYQPTGLAAYQFDPPPSIAQAFKKNRKSFREPRLSLSGVDMGESVQLVLEGYLMAATPQLLETKRAAMAAAIYFDGTLNFGSLYSLAVRPIEASIPQVYPQTYLEYAITFGYDNSAITELEITKEYSRVHKNPLIREWAYCPVRPSIIERNESAQVISYTFKASGYDLSVIRSFLANEASVIVEPGGVELPGGIETRQIRGGDPSISVRFAKIHANAVISNLSNT